MDQVRNDILPSDTVRSKPSKSSLSTKALSNNEIQNNVDNSAYFEKKKQQQKQKQQQQLEEDEFEYSVGDKRLKEIKRLKKEIQELKKTATLVEVEAKETQEKQQIKEKELMELQSSYLGQVSMYESEEVDKSHTLSLVQQQQEETKALRQEINSLKRVLESEIESEGGVHKLLEQIDKEIIHLNAMHANLFQTVQNDEENRAQAEQQAQAKQERIRALEKKNYETLNQVLYNEEYQLELQKKLQELHANMQEPEERVINLRLDIEKQRQMSQKYKEDKERTERELVLLKQNFEQAQTQGRVADETKRKEKQARADIEMKLQELKMENFRFKKPGAKSEFEDRAQIEIFQKNTILAGLQKKNSAITAKIQAVVEERLECQEEKAVLMKKLERIEQHKTQVLNKLQMERIQRVNAEKEVSEKDQELAALKKRIHTLVGGVKIPDGGLASGRIGHVKKVGKGFTQDDMALVASQNRNGNAMLMMTPINNKPMGSPLMTPSNKNNNNNGNAFDQLVMSSPKSRNSASRHKKKKRDSSPERKKSSRKKKGARSDDRYNLSDSDTKGNNNNNNKSQSFHDIFARSKTAFSKSFDSFGGAGVHSMSSPLRLDATM